MPPVFSHPGVLQRHPPIAVTIKRVNEIIRDWINYFKIGMMKQFMEELGQWLRHKIRVIVIYKVANSRLGWYRRSGMNVVNFIINKDLLENRIKDGAGLLNLLSYYLVKVGI